MLRINAPFPTFLILLSNLIGFQHLTFRRNYFHASYLFIYHENHSGTQSAMIKKKRQKIHWSTLNAHWACQKAFCTLRRPWQQQWSLGNRCLIHFPVIPQHSKGAHSFYRFVGLVVNICQWCMIYTCHSVIVTLICRLSAALTAGCRACRSFLPPPVEFTI